MLIRTSSGNTSVGHLSHAPHGFSSLHRSDFTFKCGPLLFPVHSLLLSASSKFFTDFFGFIRGQKAPEIISLDAVKCEALSPVSLGYYLDAVYGGQLPPFDTVSDCVELLRLAAFLGNAPLTSQLCAHLGSQLASLSNEGLLEVFQVAADLQLRRLVTDCLVLLLPQFGRTTDDSTVTAVIDAMDPTLSKVVLTQLALLGVSAAGVVAPAPNTTSPAATPSAINHGAETTAQAQPADPAALLGVTTPGRQDSGEFGAAVAAASARAPAPAPADLEHLKQQFVRVLEAKGWGQ